MIWKGRKRKPKEGSIETKARRIIEKEATWTRKERVRKVKENWRIMIKVTFRIVKTWRKEAIKDKRRVWSSWKKIIGRGQK